MMTHHSYNPEGGKSHSWSYFRSKNGNSSDILSLAVAWCLAVSKKDGKPLCPTLDGSPKGKASVALLMRSTQMASQKQLHSSFFLNRCVMRENGRYHIFHNEIHSSFEYISFEQNWHG
jgi:hypothetical protein